MNIKEFNNSNAICREKINNKYIMENLKSINQNYVYDIEDYESELEYIIKNKTTQKLKICKIVICLTVPKIQFQYYFCSHSIKV